MTATNDSDTILALDADCVLYTPRNTSIGDVCAILASGKNVVTTAFLFHPQRIAPADRDRLSTACQAGGATVHGSGLNPGNLSGVLPLALSGMSRTIEKITLQERADWSAYESTSITFDNMAFGQPVESISRTANQFLKFNSGLFEEQVWFLADALHAGVDEVAVTVEAVAAEADTRSSTVSYVPEPPPGNGGTGRGDEKGRRSSKSKHSGRLAVNIPRTGRHPDTAGRWPDPENRSRVSESR